MQDTLEYSNGLEARGDHPMRECFKEVQWIRYLETTFIVTFPNNQELPNIEII